jgi:hypothetical protein
MFTAFIISFQRFGAKSGGIHAIEALKKHIRHGAGIRQQI